MTLDRNVLATNISVTKQKCNVTLQTVVTENQYSAQRTCMCGQDSILIPFKPTSRKKKDFVE